MTKDSPSRVEFAVSGMDCASCALKVKTAIERLPGVSDVHVGVMSERLKLTLDEALTSRAAVMGSVRALGYGATEIARGAGQAVGSGQPAGIDQRFGEEPPKEDAGHGCAGHDHSSQGHHCGPSDQKGGAHSHSHAERNAQETGASAHGHPGHSHGSEDDRGKTWHQTARGRLVLLTGTLLALATLLDYTAAERIAAYGFALACLIGLAPVARRAFAALRTGQPFTIESLMTLAALGALIIGAAEEAALVVFLFAVGEALENVAAGQARAGIKALAALVPTTAQLDEGGTLREVPASSLQVGQVVLVRPGDRIPADGTVIEGLSGVDESPVTGESLPRLRGPGDPVFAGSINAEAALRVQVSRSADDNTIARIVRLVEEAEEARAPTERFIDRFSRWYMPAIVGLAALVALLPPLLAGQDWSTWIYRGLALLLIGCPCALVISVPASIASALSTGARRGLLLKGGAVIEAAASVRQVAFDKTGTLTHGRPEVTDLVTLLGSEAQLLSVAAAVEQGSNHPLAKAILQRAQQLGAKPLAAAAAKALSGRGVEAMVEGERALVLSPSAAGEVAALSPEVRAEAERLEGAGKTVVVVLYGGRALGLIALRDEPRQDAARAVADLAKLGVSATILTGDNPRTASAIAGQLGMSYRAGLLPEDKLGEIRALATSAPVMMIGDGINDAPALKQAAVGVAMGSGTDVALETADAAILRDRVTDVAALIRLSRATMANIRQNVTIALGLKAVFLVTSVMGLTGLWIAIMADTGATVLVTLNALRLLRYNPETISAAPPRAR